MKTRNEREQGIIILIVAVFMLFVVGAMAALSIDVVALYTARSEAQLAADAAALAGARVFANSGMTSDPNAFSDGLMTSTETLARTVATQVASSNLVGGRNLSSSGACALGLEISVCFNDSDLSFTTNPRVTVQTSRTDLPTFFARIWGRTTVTVRASATAEAYNPSGVNALGLGFPVVPVAPTCVKPIVLPNLSPDGAASIVDGTTGDIVDTGLLGKDLTTTLPPALLRPDCGGPLGPCSTLTLHTPQPWRFYPGDQSSFPAPTNVPNCPGGSNNYQNSITGCVQMPIACGSTVFLESAHGNLENETDNAVNCLTNTSNNAGDRFDPASGPPLPFLFLTGDDNPLVIAGAISPATDVVVSNSIVTVPIYDSSGGAAPISPVTVIGFVQLFLNPDGNAAPATVGGTTGILARVINIAGCGNNLAPQPILGNGASPVPVRLISP